MWVGVCGDVDEMAYSWMIYLYVVVFAATHALRMQTTAKLLGSPDPLFSFPLKLIGADHGLHPFWLGVGLLDSQYGLEGLGVSCLRSSLVQEMKSSLADSTPTLIKP